MSPNVLVAAWIVHGMVLGTVALVLPAVFRMRHPASLANWWSYGAFAVVAFPVMAWLLPTRSSVPLPVPVATFVDAATAMLGETPASSSAALPVVWLYGLWVAGVLARLAWLMAGHRGLRTLAAAGAPVVDDPALSQARSLAPTAALPPLAAEAVPVVAVADAGPCAFGALAPCVLVPVSLRDRPEAERVAVYLHELAHVARGDVGRGHADEVWRTVWWWQPAVWWMLARLRLARELEVDALVVARTGRLRAYVEALLWCSTLRPAVSPSAQVGGRRHALVERVALMCKEGEMSRTRRWMTIGAMVGVMGVVTGGLGAMSPLGAASGGVVTAWAQLPAAEPGPLERRAVRPTLDAPAPRRTLAVEPAWNDRSSSYRFRAHVVVDVTGRVAEARLVGAPATSAVPDDVLPDLEAARTAALDAVRQWQFEAPVAAPMLLVVDVTVGDARLVRQVDRAARDLRAPGASAHSPLRVGGTVRPPRRLVNVFPTYPEAAKSEGIAGVVIIEATLDTEGSVEDARVLRSIPALDAAAIDAVRQWRYEPTLLNGEPVPVIMTVTVNFTLQP